MVNIIVVYIFCRVARIYQVVEEEPVVSASETHAVALVMEFPLLCKTNWVVILHKEVDNSALHGSVSTNSFWQV